MHMGTTSGYFLQKFFFRSLAVAGFVCLLIVGSISRDGTTRLEATKWSSERLKHGKVIGRDNKPVKNEELDFNYMSKRRVPNGPDPIHNRNRAFIYFKLLGSCFNGAS
ncbi:PREDICTED: CLAVATA3/ESR (CLE)-related protein 25-like isoform X1 [Lupinus angustifolius]|uniref:CLAVATA3/ESR (CLE)-related protein 25-like isoform X1 n=1 Tax=Lupinus angustifolius TaxID=3871 RepID=UPI00092E69A9|nr:PREDICTED: CLAVATA3/ESR (CLE)-related protein 25-like isoform X1 [Lupinus angustifolius]